MPQIKIQNDRKNCLKSPLNFMSAKLRNFVILILSLLGSIATVVYLTNRQPNSQASATKNNEQRQSLLANQTQEVVLYPERSHYKTIPLEKINSVLQGSDPADLALNAFEDSPRDIIKPHVEVVYPKPNHALVTITQTLVKSHFTRAIKYRVELTTFGRSILVSSPRVWQIVWAGSQTQCLPQASHEQNFNAACH